MTSIKSRCGFKHVRKFFRLSKSRSFIQFNGGEYDTTRESQTCYSSSGSRSSSGRFRRNGRDRNSTEYLRQIQKALGINEGSVKVYDPFQMLAEVEEPVRKSLEIDTFGIQLPRTVFGYKNENWKPFTLFDGTEVRMSGNFEYDILDNGDIVQYPQGNRNAPPSAIMPKDGYYFDSIIRQEPIEDDKLDPKEWADQMYSIYTDEDLRFLEETTKWYYENTEYALIGNFWGGNFGDIAQVPGLAVLHPKGIRDQKEWYMSLVTRKDYVKEIFQRTLEIGLENLKLYQQATGDKIDVIVISGRILVHKPVQSILRKRIGVV